MKPDVSAEGNPLWEKGSWHRGLGGRNYCWAASPGTSWCQGHTTRGKNPFGSALDHTVTPCLCFTMCRIPHFTGSVSESQLMLTKANEPGITATQVSAFWRKMFFLLTTLPTNSLTKDLFVGQELANIKAWQSWLYGTLVQLISPQFTATGKKIKPLSAEGAVHLYPPMSQGRASFPGGVNYY